MVHRGPGGNMNNLSHGHLMYPSCGGAMDTGVALSSSLGLAWPWQLHVPQTSTWSQVAAGSKVSLWPLVET